MDTVDEHDLEGTQDGTVYTLFVCTLSWVSYVYMVLFMFVSLVAFTSRTVGPCIKGTINSGQLGQCCPNSLGMRTKLPLK